MAERGVRRPPGWFFAILTVGGLLASGLYLGMMRVEGATAGHVLRATAYGVFGLLMLWGVLGKR